MIHVAAQSKRVIVCRFSTLLLLLAVYAGVLSVFPEEAYAITINQTANPAGVAASSAVATYTAVSIGTAASTRIVAVVVGTEFAASTPSAATIDSGGGAVAMIAATSANQGSVFSQIFYANVPTGTTATITVTFTAASPGDTANHIAVYSITAGAITLSAQGSDPSTDMDATSPLTTGSVTIPTGGGFLGVSAGAAGTAGQTWANVTEVLDVDAGTFHLGTATSTSAGTATRTVTGVTNGEDGALSYIIFKVTAPLVTTGDTIIGDTNATLFADITDHGGSDATQSGFAYSTVSTLNTGVSTTTLGAQSGATAFSQGIGGLIANTTYFYRAYATNATGDGLGTIRSFTTGNTTPTRSIRLFGGQKLKFYNGSVLFYQR